MSSTLHRQTPTLRVTDARRLQVAVVAYHRQTLDEALQARTERYSRDVLGRVHAQWDTRLWATGGETGEPNQVMTHSLSGQLLRVESVDAGWRVNLVGDAAQTLHSWDGRGTVRRVCYDSQIRQVSVSEESATTLQTFVERLTYGSSTEMGNRCGRLVRHDDGVGSQVFVDYGLLGHVAGQTQQFLKALVPADWPESLDERDALLETDHQGAAMRYLTQWHHDALNQLLRQTDALANVQSHCYNVAGELVQSSLTEDGKPEQLLLSAVRYNACGQVESQLAGNGVISRPGYDARSGRLLRLNTIRQDKVLQDLHYQWDPVGNLQCLEDRAQPTQWFDSQRIVPVSTYRYDTLYHLIEATGRESVLAGIQPGLPGVVLPGGGDASRLRNYTQVYTYDLGGNLITLKHGSEPLRMMKTAERSNRSMYMADEMNPPDLANGFDANGNLLMLDGAQRMTWDARNQLHQVTQVLRKAGPADNERYFYHGTGQRGRKVRVWQAKSVEHVAQVMYLPGLEIHSDTATGEVLHVISVAVGRSQVRRLNWRANGRKRPPVPQWRYNVDDHLGSVALELDEYGDVISHEGYYPFGGTAWWAVRSQTHVNGKTIRYSGQERDATGLYYYGSRYYAPWLMRWINPDPSGEIDGLNLYRMVRNNPLRYRDHDGRAPEVADDYSDNSSSAHVPAYRQNPETFRRRDVDAHVAAERRDAVERSMTHRMYGEHRVESTYTSASIPGRYRFRNEFLPGRWRLMENYRAPVEGPNATDVTWHQYEMISRHNNFYGVLPQAIVRWNVQNNEALLATQQQEGMLERFLASEGNGRSTQRIMTAFGLRATGITRQEVYDYQLGADVDIIEVHVEPQPVLEPAPMVRSPSLEALTRAVERDLRRAARNPVSRVAHRVWRNMRRVIQGSSARRALR